MSPLDVIEGRARWCVVEGDSADVLASLPPASVHALVTDPPAGIKFMGREWDRDRGGRAQWVAWLASVLGLARVAVRPGGRAFVWALPRTTHWTGCAVEDAGWAIETVVTHLFGTGWPKGASQLKPSSEHWYLARTGPSTPLNVDGCRVGSESTARQNRAPMGYMGNDPAADGYTTGSTSGRWPPNTLFTHSQFVWYALRHDTPAAAADAIHAFYGTLQKVRALRDGVSGDSIGSGEAQVLQQGVRWRVPQEREEGRVGSDPVRGVRGPVQRDPGMGEERAEEVLHEAVPRQGARGSDEGGHRPHRRVTGEDVGVVGGHATAGEVVAVEGGALPGLGGLRPCDGRQPPGRADGGGAGAHEEGLCVGAPAGDVAGPQPAGHARRGGAPRQREEGGQPAGEPLCRGAEGALRAAPAHGEGTAHPPARSDSAARGEPRLEVASFAIIPAWADYFVAVGTGGCERAVERRVASASRLDGGAPRVGNVYGGDNRERPAAGYADPDGTELVEAWRCVEGCPVAELDAQSGEGTSTGGQTNQRSGWRGAEGCARTVTTLADPGKGDTGTASRFFPCFPADDPAAPFAYIPKPAPAEKRAGLDDAHASHPTVKPVALMRWLIRLLTEPGDIVLDPFGGSGTTGVAALLEGRRVILVERDPDFAAICRARLEHAAPDARTLSARVAEPIAAPRADFGPLFGGSR